MIGTKGFPLLSWKAIKVRSEVWRRVRGMGKIFKGCNVCGDVVIMWSGFVRYGGSVV